MHWTANLLKRLCFATISAGKGQSVVAPEDVQSMIPPSICGHQAADALTLDTRLVEPCIRKSNTVVLLTLATSGAGEAVTSRQLGFDLNDRFGVFSTIHFRLEVADLLAVVFCHAVEVLRHELHAEVVREGQVLQDFVEQLSRKSLKREGHLTSVSEDLERSTSPLTLPFL